MIYITYYYLIGTSLYNLGGDSFVNILIYFLNLRQLIWAQNSKQWKPPFRYSFECTGCLKLPNSSNIIDVNEHPLIGLIN